MTTTIKDEGAVVGVCWVEGGALIDAFVTGFRSVQTRSNYRANLLDSMRWTAGIGVNAGQAERLHVEAYIRDLEGRGYAPNTICQRIATLSSFYRWAVVERKLVTNPVERCPQTATPPTPLPSTSPGATDVCYFPPWRYHLISKEGGGTDDRPAHPRRT